MPRGDHWPDWRTRLSTGYLETPGGCHQWQRATNSRGYGVIYFAGRLHLAHRAAWFAAHGEWPSPNRVIDHICENKACVNAAHLRELTSGDNIRRAVPNYGRKKRGGVRNAVV